MYRWFLVFIVCVNCAKVSIDTRGVDTPRGWTVDKSSGDVTAAKAFDQGKTLDVDSFNSEEGITTKAVMSASDSIENIKANVEKFNKLVSINVALRNALKERQDKTCFVTKPLKELEVHVHTRLSPLRAYEPLDDKKWPKITVDLDDESNGFKHAKVIDGGVIVFSREYQPDPEKKDKKNIEERYSQTINHLQKIEVKLDDDDTDRGWVFAEFKEEFGRKHCESRFLGSCEGSYSKGKIYFEEGNKVLIDKVEVRVKLVGDTNNRFYKIFADDQQTIELSSAVRHYNFDGFRQNPHWVLHAYSSKCDGWSGDHDGSEFAREVWQKIQDGDRVTNDFFATNFSCVEQRLLPNLVTPQNPSPDITKEEDRDPWLTNNKPFAPADDKEECQPVTAESIAENASGVAVDPKCRLPIPDDLDDRSKENLELLRDIMQKYVSAGEESNAGMKQDFDDLSKSGCFYDKKLTDGIKVEIEGQYLLDVAGQYMTDVKFTAKGQELAATHQGSFMPPSINDGVPLYINLGLDKRSYPLIPQFFASGDDSIYISGKKIIDPDYTKNFTVRDISFVHLNRGGDYRNEKATISKEYEKSSWHGFANPQEDTAMTIDIEYGIVNIQKIALFLGDDKKPFYKREAGNKAENSNGVKGGLFTLNSIVNSWTDYNIKNNLAWNEKRSGDGCSD